MFNGVIVSGGCGWMGAFASSDGTIEIVGISTQNPNSGISPHLTKCEDCDM
jgi:hypothetical protein